MKKKPFCRFLFTSNCPFWPPCLFHFATEGNNWTFYSSNKSINII